MPRTKLKLKVKSKPKKLRLVARKLLPKFRGSSFQLKLRPGLRTAPDIGSEFVTVGTLGDCKAAGGAAKRKAGKAYLRDCHVTLVMVSPEDAAERGVRPGPALQLCTKIGEAGTLIPVDSHEDAQEKSRQYCECVKREGRERCTTKFAAGKREGLRRKSGR